MLVGTLNVDVLVAALGIAAGMAAKPVGCSERHPKLARVRRGVWGFGISVLLGAMLPPALMVGARSPVGSPLDLVAIRAGFFGFVLAFISLACVLAIVQHIWTDRGRRRLGVSWRRRIEHEWWPTWALYGPALTPLLSDVLRSGGPTGFTAINPGIGAGGGSGGESKSTILASLPSETGHVLMYALVDEATPDARIGAARTAVRTQPALGGLPVVCKPDQGERGHLVAVVRTGDELDDYARRAPGPFIVQRYHPGPEEFGVMWVRQPETVGSEREDEPQGSIYSINAKTLPLVLGDGMRTVEQLVWDHPRFRMHAEAFCNELGTAELRRVPAFGELVRLGDAGNHARGAMFTDATYLATPELEAAIDELARRFVGPNGGRLDLARFDVRCGSEAALKAGRFGIVEMNGALSESTNIYDPHHDAWWAWGVLRGQWRRTFQLARARIEAGGRPMGSVAYVRMLLGYLRRRKRATRSASHAAD